MNITLTSLEALILKATNESLPCGQPDHPAVEAFWAIAKDSPEGPQLAAQALAARIHSQNLQEALLALTMLDQCMRRGDRIFLAEIGKFRFLNELIKLVSPKYLAGRTAPEVRLRILQLIHAWSNEYPKETKFKVAYDMLRNQGVIITTPPPIRRQEVEQPKTRTKNVIFEDEEKSTLLQKLLQSKKPEDIQHANRLIKTMVREEEQRSELSSRRAAEVSSALDSAGLLRDMLAHAAAASAEEEQLIHELHARCVRLRPVLQRLAGGDADDLDDILNASDVLDEVFEMYRVFTSEKTSKVLASQDVAEAQSNRDSLLDFAGGQSKENPKNALEELGDIFSSEASGCTMVQPLKPDSLLLDAGTSDPEPTGSVGGAAAAWSELDSLGERLLQQSLPADRAYTFNGKTKKVPMNALEKLSPKQEPMNNAILDLDFFTRKPEPQQAEKPQPVQSSTPTLLETDDIMVDISTTNGNNNDKTPEVVAENVTIATQKTEESQAKEEIKPLTDINVTLESVRPSDVPPMTVFDEAGVSVVLHLCRDRPRPDVRVVVVSTTSRKDTPIEDYKFQAVVPKGCKVRLLPASGGALPAAAPFVPPPALTQLMLLAPPALTHLKFLLSYTCEGETCSDIGEVSNLPLEDL